MMRFANPEWLGLLVVAPLIAAWWWWHAARRRGAVTYSSRLLVPRARSLRQRVLWVPAALRLAAITLAIIALARPQNSLGETRTKAKGIALTMVVDRSWSMIEEIEFDGGKASRIDAVKRIFKDFVLGDGEQLAGRPEDMIGLVTFALYADTICPLTRSHDTLVKLVEDIELARPEGGEAGTSIGEGLALAVARLKRADEELRKQNDGKIDPEFSIKSKIIVLLSDGSENTGSIKAREAAVLAKEAGIKVYAIGIGGGTPQPGETPFGRLRRGPQYAYDGRTLREVAQISGGVYRETDDADSLRAVYAEIDKLEKTEIEANEFTTYDEKFAPLAAATGALLLAEVLLAAFVLRRSP